MTPFSLQPLFNAAFLGITNPPQQPSPENVTAAYVKKALDTITPRMEQLKAAGLLQRGYIYAFVRVIIYTIDNPRCCAARCERITKGAQRCV